MTGIVGSKVRTIPGLYDKVYTGTAIKVWKECGYDMVNIQTKDGVRCVELCNTEFVDEVNQANQHAHHPECMCNYCVYGREALPGGEY